MAGFCCGWPCCIVSSQEADIKTAVEALPAGMKGLVSEAIDLIKRLKTLDERKASESQGHVCLLQFPFWGVRLLTRRPEGP